MKLFKWEGGNCIKHFGNENIFPHNNYFLVNRVNPITQLKCCSKKKLKCYNFHQTSPLFENEVLEKLQTAPIN